MGPKAVIFDFDGVILDSSGVAFKILNEVAKRLNLNLELKNKKYWGLSGLRTLEKLFPHASRKEIERVRRGWRIKELKLSIPLFPHALEVVSTFKGKGLITGLLTNRSAQWIRFYGDKFGIDYQRLFDFIQTRERRSWLFKKIFRKRIHPNHFTSYIYKPDFGAFDPALKFLGKIGVKKEQIIYVADTVMDYIASLLAGIEFVAIIGHGPLERKDFEKQRVKYILDSIEELPGLLAKLK